MPALFDTVQLDGLSVVPLASGSRGNCTWIGDHRHGFLVDCGVSARQILERMAAVGLSEAPIDAVLLTHEHTDHVASAGVLDRALERRRGVVVPFLLTAGTLGGMADKIRPRDLRRVRAGEHIPWNDVVLEPHAIPHDTAEPIAWAIETRGVRAGVITDLGHAPRLVQRLLASLDLAVVEFNHDVERLFDNDRYPWALKQRIRGKHGHLSNEQAADLLRHGTSDRLRHVVLAHLSRDNNVPELALQAAEAALREAGRTGLQVHVALQDRALEPVTVAARPHAVPGRTARARTPDPADPPHPSLFDGH